MDTTGGMIKSVALNWFSISLQDEFNKIVALNTNTPGIYNSFSSKTDLDQTIYRLNGVKLVILLFQCKNYEGQCVTDIEQKMILNWNISFHQAMNF